MYVCLFVCVRVCVCVSVCECLCERKLQARYHHLRLSASLTRLSLLDRLLIIPTVDYTSAELEQILKIRCVGPPAFACSCVCVCVSVSVSVSVSVWS